MQNSPTVYVQYTIETSQKQGVFVTKPLKTIGEDLKNMDIDTIHDLYSSLQAVTAQLRERILQEAKQGLINIGLKT